MRKLFNVMGYCKIADSENDLSLIMSEEHEGEATVIHKNVYPKTKLRRQKYIVLFQVLHNVTS